MKKHQRLLPQSRMKREKIRQKKKKKKKKKKGRKKRKKWIWIGMIQTVIAVMKKKNKETIREGKSPKKKMKVSLNLKQVVMTIRVVPLSLDQASMRKIKKN